MFAKFDETRTALRLQPYSKATALSNIFIHSSYYYLVKLRSNCSNCSNCSNRSNCSNSRKKERFGVATVRYGPLRSCYTPIAAHSPTRSKAQGIVATVAMEVGIATVATAYKILETLRAARIVTRKAATAATEPQQKKTSAVVVFFNLDRYRITKPNEHTTYTAENQLKS